jgi:acetylornithine deacetylase/succinyl-diaminopimelate desuccinylase-like protein
MSPFLDWFRTHSAALRQDYFAFLRFASISADPHYRESVKACADWLKTYVQKHTSLQAECISTPGYPLVYAENLQAGPSKPTLLIYGHYDVQPIDPIELWKSNPFEPEERNGQIFARGAVDDKGQIFYALLAARFWKESNRKLPINLKFCIEGEEESSSLGLAKALPHIKHRLQADYLLVPDFDQFDAKTPAISLGARGLVSLEVTLTGSYSDLHSGLHGGMAYNPNRALAELLAELWDEEGRVQVEGFYDGVSEAKEAGYTFRFEPKHYQQEFGVGALGGEKGKTLEEANCFRPTLEINGIVGGYTGAGIKTVIPAKATAKLSCRLVPGQDPQKIAHAVDRFLRQRAKSGMKIDVTISPGSFAFRGNPHSQLAQAVAKASEEVTGIPCKKVLSGASIPIVADLVQATGAEVVGMGYGLPEDNIHAPNECFDWSRLEKGFATVARTLELL